MFYLFGKENEKNVTLVQKGFVISYSGQKIIIFRTFFKGDKVRRQLNVYRISFTDTEKKMKERSRYFL